MTQRSAVAFVALLSIFAVPDLVAQEPKLDTARIEEITGLKGTLIEQEGVFKVSAPRTDVKVAVDGWAMPPFMGLTSWAAFHASSGGKAMVMGDLVLFQDEVNQVMSEALDAGLEVTALHNHFFFDEPKVYFMHIGGEAPADVLARGVRRAFDKVKEIRTKSPTPAASFEAMPLPQASAISAAPIEAGLGVKGQANNGMFKVVIGRTAKAHGGHEVAKEMGVNTWAAFAGSDDNAVVDGDFAMLEDELQGVLKTLRKAGINIVAIHHHMSGETPRILFLHYWGRGNTAALARGLKAALDTQEKSLVRATAEYADEPVAAASPAKATSVLFICEHGAAKSVLGAAYFAHLAKERGLDVKVDSAGTVPDAAVAPLVATHLEKQGYEVPIAKPRQVTVADLATADIVVTMGCELKGLPKPTGRLLKWDEVPGPGQDLSGAEEAIRKRTAALVEELSQQKRSQ